MANYDYIFDELLKDRSLASCTYNKWKKERLPDEDTAS